MIFSIINAVAVDNPLHLHFHTDKYWKYLSHARESTLV